MVVQVRAQGSVVDRLEKLVAGCNGTMVRADAMTQVEQPRKAATVTVVDEASDYDLTEATKVMSRDKALDVAVIAPAHLSTGEIREAVKATGWKVRKLLSAGDASTDWVVSYVASKLGIESMVIPTEVGDDRQEMLFWFSDAVLVLLNGRDDDRLVQVANEAARQGKPIALRRKGTVTIS